MMGAYAEVSKAISIETLKYAIPLSLKKKLFIKTNLAAVDEGVRFAMENFND